MARARHIGWILLLPLVLTASPPRHKTNGTRLHIGPVISFYTVNRHHAGVPSQKASFLAGFAREFNADRDYHAYFLIGIDYLYHAVGFNTYYFAPDTPKVYTGQFDFHYDLGVHELQVPVIMKYLFKREDNSLFSPYVQGGYHLRYLVGSRLRVSQNGQRLTEDEPQLRFRHPLLAGPLNACVSLGGGWQKNHLSSSHGSFYAGIEFRYNFSPFSFETGYAPSSLNINSTQLVVQVGVKF